MNGTNPADWRQADPLQRFHPAVAAWFRDAFAAPTEIQERAWAQIGDGRHTLIAAPTGSGKTLAAFLSAIDGLVRRSVDGSLTEATSVLYVSPLKALSNDIHRNLEQPLAGIHRLLDPAGSSEEALAPIRAMVRTGDTPSGARTAMTRRPPHILVTTPESLYLLLTADGGRRMLRTVETVIVDEIHAVVGSKRGSHLALSLERLQALTPAPPRRIGLSATQKPIERVAEYLAPAGDPCAIVDIGHRRRMDTALELPDSPLAAVMSNEVWEEIYARLCELIDRHRTTLIFVNTRRMAERSAHELSERLGPDAVAAHHGSMSKETRMDAERRLKQGSLRALVATASLELGIDIGSVDLVCQLGSPRSIMAFLQRVGRSGHAVGATPKGRLFPLSRDDLVEGCALLASAARGDLDEIPIPDAPLDILAQQIVAECAAREWSADELYAVVCGAYPYRGLARERFDTVVRMLAEGFTTRRGRRGAYLHLDAVNGRLRGRRGARLTALTGGGAIPDTFDYEVRAEPDETMVGTIHEDFAIESMAGDVFQLGNTSWRILQVAGSTVRVAHAGDQRPTIPFWLGEAPGRTPELSSAVSELRERTEAVIREAEERGDPAAPAAAGWLASLPGVPASAAEQAAEYLTAGRNALGAMPTCRTLVMERFFDEAGDMHLVIHSPHGTRLNRGWGLALRKRFCRTFNFELQAAATDDAIVLSLGPTHSFRMQEVWNYLHPNSVRDVLVQALLDAPMFQVRWRWNASRALAVPRWRGGRRTPPYLQRMQAEDLVALVFPDQLACAENLTGEREVPDHPLVTQTIDDCLTEAMDIDALHALLAAMRAGELTLVCRDLSEPSPFAQEILNARPYAFLDDAPLEERRTQAVRNRRWLDPQEARELGALDPGAIARVRNEAWPRVEDADDLHDALVLLGYLTEAEGRRGDGTRDWVEPFEQLAAEGRAARQSSPAGPLWVAAERLPEWLALAPDAERTPELTVPGRYLRTYTADEALRELLRGRLEALGPVTGEELAASIGQPPGAIAAALIALETEGFVMQGSFTGGTGADGPASGDGVEWCERRLLARINRYTLDRLRREIEPVSKADYVRFLMRWQHVGPTHHMAGPEGLAEVLAALDGVELPAAAWEQTVLPLRVRDYDPSWLDALCLSGRVVWARFPDDTAGAPVKATRIALLSRERRPVWQRLAGAGTAPAPATAAAREVQGLLQEAGASFFDDIVAGTRLLRTQVEGALGELVAAGLVTCDGFAGLRALIGPSSTNGRSGNGSRRGGARRFGTVYRRQQSSLETAGRWSLAGASEEPAADGDADEQARETAARALLKRYGVVFRRLTDREPHLPPWRELVRTLRRLETRGEIRGGHFVSGVGGEQFALPEAVGALREVRRTEATDEVTVLSAVDPVNALGVTVPSGARLAARAGNRVAYRAGRPIAVLDGGRVIYCEQLSPEDGWSVQKRLLRAAVTEPAGQDPTRVAKPALTGAR